MTIAAHQPSGQLLPAVWKLLALRWRININSFKHAKLRTKILNIIGIIALLGFVGLVFWASWMLLGFLRSPQLVKYTGFDVSPFLDAVPVLIFTTMFLGILFTSFGVLLQAMYLSGDMDFLLASPVPIRAVFVAKLLQAVLPNLGFMAAFGLPLLYGLGASRSYNLLYYPLVLVIMGTLTLAAAGLSSLLVMLIVRVVPARRVAEVLGFVGATVSILCSQTGNLMNFSRRGEDISSDQINTLISLLTRLNNPWLPLNWAGRGLVELGGGNLLLGIALVSLTVGLFAGIFWIALLTAERWYYSGWARMQIVARKKRTVSAPHPYPLPRGRLLSRLVLLLPAPVRGLMQKDFIVMRRDLRNLSQLVTPIIFGVIYALAFLRGGDSPSSERGRVAMTYITPLLAYANIGIALFVGWMLLARLGGMAFSQEGKNFWILKSAPLRAQDLLTAKFLVAYLPALTLGGVFLTATSVLHSTPIFSFLYSLLITALCLAGMAGILVGFGAAGANLTWDDPRKMNAGTLGCLGTILTALFTPLALGFFILPLLIVSFLGLPDAYGYIAGALLGVSISLCAALLPLWLARKKVEQLGEA